MSIVIRAEREGEYVPPEYVKCSEEEAINHQLSTIKEWSPKSDVWPFVQGPQVFSILGALSGGLIASIFRRRLKLEHYGRMSMYLPAVGVPGTFGPLLHYQLVTRPLTVQSECPVCLQMRSILIQNTVGVGYPIVISAGTGLLLAERYGTYRLPEFSMKVIPEFINIARGLLSKHTNKILGLVVVSTLVAGFITDRQAKSLFTISQKLMEYDDTEP